MTTTGQASRALQDLGFTALEAQVYAYLLQHAPATGYRISHAIGKPTANTYKALAALADQGAVLLDDGGGGAARAVPPAELLAGLERRARERREAAAAALADLAPEGGDDRVYALRDRDQVLERARAMLGRARQIALADLFPAVLVELRDDLAGCAARGVSVTVRAYAPADLGAALVVSGEGRGAPGRWPGQQLSLVVDGSEHLLALLSADLQQVHQAVWSGSAFLSCLHHNHLAMEMLVAARRAGGTEGRLDGITVLAADPPGLRRLRAQVTGGVDAAEDPDDNPKG
ncbi:MAG: TrmB family transcriptional regulator [bacterium]|nr:TrmB family transcriptional regulator [bacterium]